MKTVFHAADGSDDIQDATIRYASGIFEDDTVETDAVTVVANASGIELVRSDSAYSEDITALSEENIRFIACEKSMEAAELTHDDILDVVDTAPTSVGILTQLQENGYRYIKVP
jgi:intracellular sulfur oxidation DsrE/DsrF family protein